MSIRNYFANVCGRGRFAIVAEIVLGFREKISHLQIIVLHYIIAVFFKPYNFTS